MAELSKDIKETIEAAEQSRKKFEMAWYVVDNFWENNHFLKQMNQLGKLEPVKFPKGIQIRAIPRAKKQVSSMVNLVLSNDPRWNIYPRPTLELLQDLSKMERYEETVKRMGHYFDDLWYYLDLKDKVRELVTYGFKYNVGYLEIGADAEGNVFADAYEPYDIWHDAGIKSTKEASHLVKGVSRTIQYVREAVDADGKPLYDPACTEKLKPEERLSLSEWKNIRLQEKARGTLSGGVSDPRIARVFLREIWIKDGKTWKLTTECQGKQLRETDSELSRVPIISYAPQEGLLYQPSYFEDLIPMNKGIDIQAAMVEGYARTTAVARMMKSKMSKIARVLNEHGEVIEYEGTQKPEWLPPGPAPTTSIQALQMYRDLMDEIGTTVLAFGKVPKGVKAAEALESLKSSEYSNAKTPIDLLESALEETAEVVLDLIDRSVTEPVTVPHMTDGRPDPFQIVSDSGSLAAENENNDAIRVSSKYMVKVQIESGLAATEEGKRATVRELGDSGYLPKEEVLKAYKYTNVGDILDKLQAEKAQGVSIVETPEFTRLPPQLRLQILQALGVQLPTSPGPTTPAPAPTSAAAAPLVPS